MLSSFPHFVLTALCPITFLDFNTQPHDPAHHALRHKTSTGIVWMFAHLPLLAFVLVFGVSVKSVLYLNRDWGTAVITLRHWEFMSLPIMLLFWTIEFIKMTHSGL